MDADQGTPRDQHFDADRPIERREQDRLGRQAFAEAIARQVLAIPAEHGFTIAVVGEWGSGKTSVLNMVSEALGDHDEAPAVLRFNPWLFGGVDDLATRFFGELGAQLNQRNDERLKDVARALSSIGQSLGPLIPFPGTITVAHLIAKVTAKWASAPSLLEKRNQLRKALAQSDTRIIVLIDDIDRLEHREAREVMRLVRLTSDLPNLVFLLAFDRARVAKSLDDNDEAGRQYLNKIVQVSHNIPVASKSTLTEMLLEGLNRLIDARDLGEPDHEAWMHVLYDVLRPLLGNPRDVKRYLNSLPVTLDAVGQEVALADLLGLEALRILRPRIFEELRAHTDFLVNSDPESQRFMTQDERKRDAQKKLSGMLERAAGDRALVESVLRTLFPVAQEFLSRSSYGSTSFRAWRRERRVASAPVLQIYLRATVDEAALRSSEVRELVDALSDENKLSQLLDSFDEPRLEEALERLGDFEQDFSIDTVRTAVPVLANRMGQLSEHAAGPLLISRLLRCVEDRQALATAIRSVLERVGSLSASFVVVSRVGHRGSLGQKLIPATDAAELEGQLVERLEAATSEELAGEWSLSPLTLQALSWLEGEGKDCLAIRLREHLRDDGFVLTLLRTSVSYGYSNSDVQKLLRPWDALVEAFGDQLAESAGRLAHSQVYREATEDDQDTVDLARKYSSGERPEGWGLE